MKTFKNLYPQIVKFENLLSAAYKAARGKRERIYVMAFFEELEENLFALQEQLIRKTYTPGNISLSILFAQIRLCAEVRYPEIFSFHRS
jgi:hypothetical protein